MLTLRPIRSIRGLLALLLSVLLISVPALRADVTVRFKNDFKLGALLAPTIAQQGLDNFKSLIPAQTVTEIKGGKMYSESGPFAVLLNLASEEITLVDSSHKQFVTTYLKDYIDELNAAMPTVPAMPAQAQEVLNSMKTGFSSRKTGQTAAILGMQAEESELTFTLDMSLPPGANMPGGTSQAGKPISLMKMVMHIWTVTPSETARVPALTEWNSYKSSTATYFLNPLSVVQRIFASLPGLGKDLTSMSEELSKNQGVVLKSQVEMYLPIMVQVAPALRAQGKLSQDFDPSAPFLEITHEAVEVSGKPIDDSVFQVPGDYRAIPLPDLMKSLTPPSGKPQASPAVP